MLLNKKDVAILIEHCQAYIDGRLLKHTRMGTAHYHRDYTDLLDSGINVEHLSFIIKHTPLTEISQHYEIVEPKKETETELLQKLGDLVKQIPSIM